jgi:hypothetical protein
MGAGGSTEQQKLAWEWVQGMQQPDVMKHVTWVRLFQSEAPGPGARGQAASRSPGASSGALAPAVPPATARRAPAARDRSRAATC